MSSSTSHSNVDQSIETNEKNRYKFKLSKLATNLSHHGMIYKIGHRRESLKCMSIVGLEPTAIRLKARCSNQLSYIPTRLEI